MQPDRKRMNVLLYLSSGSNRVGTEAKLISTVADIRKSFGDSLGEITVLTKNKLNQKRSLDDPTVKLIEIGATGLLNPRIWLRRIDVVFLAFDAAWWEARREREMLTYLSLIRTAALLRKRVVVYSSDCVELDRNGQAELRNAMKHVDLTLISNRACTQRIKAYGVRNEVYTTADNTLLFPATSDAARDRLLDSLRLDPSRNDILVVTPREFFCVQHTPGSRSGFRRLPILRRDDSACQVAAESRERYIRQVAAYCDRMVAEYDMHVALIAMEPSEEPICLRIHEQMLSRHRVRRLSCTDYTVRDIGSLLSVANMLVASHYYAALLASAYGVPMLGICGEPNLEMIMRELGQAEHVLDYVTRPNNTPNTYKLDDQLFQRSESLLQQAESIRDMILKANGTLRSRAEKSHRLAQTWIERTFFQGESFSDDATATA